MFKTCLICGVKFDASNAKQKYCSRKCRDKAARKPRKQKKCPSCGKIFTAPLTRPSQIFCCNVCRAKADRGITYENKECHNCGKKFQAIPWRHQKFCSVQCGIDYHKGITLIEKICPQCKKTFQSESWRRQKFCSVQCGIDFNRGKPRSIRQKSAPQKQIRNRAERRTKDGRRIALHRLIMEEKIGRKLESFETVHHIDMDRNNNEIDNLYLYRNESTHIKGHHSIEPLIKFLIKNGVVRFQNGKYSLIDEKR